MRKKPPVTHWQPAFEGQRAPFEPGNTLSVGNRGPMTHGSYALVKLGPRVEELATVVRELVPAYTPADEIGVRVLCLALARLERSSAALDDATLTPEELARLRQDERGWANTVRRFLADYGLSPLSRAQLGVDLTRVAAAREAALAGLEAEGRRLRLARTIETEGHDA